MRVVALLAMLFFCEVAWTQIQLFPAAPRPRNEGKVEAEKPRDDAKALAEAKLSAEDIPGLIAYFRTRTLSNDDLSKIQHVIARFGDEDFEARQRASGEAVSFGPAAIGPLRAAASSSTDPEIRWRAIDALRSIEKVSHTAVATAAARALARSQHPEAAEALLGFLPMADTAAVDEEIRAALKMLALNNGQLAPCLVQGVKDVNPIRRAAAAIALIEATLKDRQIPSEVLDLVKPMLQDDPDSDARFRVSFVLAAECSYEWAIQALVRTIPDLPRGQLWQVEDMLLQFAGPDAPTIRFPEARSALQKASDDWLTWLQAHRTAEQYQAFRYQPRTTGRLLMMWQDQNWGNGRVVELGADMKPRFRILGIMAPADISSLPNGNIEILEHNYSRISERDRRGAVVRQQQLPGGQPVSIQRMDDGKILVAHRHQVVICDSKWKELHRWNRNTHDCLAAARHGNGPIYVMVQNPSALIRLDDQLKELPNTISIGAPYYQAKMEMLPNDRVLLTEQNRVAEYDLKEGKLVWKFETSNPSCVQRLPNGNTLICDFQVRSVREISPESDVLWTFTPPDGLQPLRAYRQ